MNSNVPVLSIEQVLKKWLCISAVLMVSLQLISCGRQAADRSNEHDRIADQTQNDFRHLSVACKNEESRYDCLERWTIKLELIGCDDVEPINTNACSGVVNPMCILQSSNCRGPYIKQLSNGLIEGGYMVGDNPELSTPLPSFCDKNSGWEETRPQIILERLGFASALDYWSRTEDADYIDRPLCIKEETFEWLFEDDYRKLSLKATCNDNVYGSRYDCITDLRYVYSQIGCVVQYAWCNPAKECFLLSDNCTGPDQHGACEDGEEPRVVDEMEMLQGGLWSFVGSPDPLKPVLCVNREDRLAELRAKMNLTDDDTLLICDVSTQDCALQMATWLEQFSCAMPGAAKETIQCFEETEEDPSHCVFNSQHGRCQHGAACLDDVDGQRYQYIDIAMLKENQPDTVFPENLPKQGICLRDYLYLSVLHGY